MIRITSAPTDDSNGIAQSSSQNKKLGKTRINDDSVQVDNASSSMITRSIKNALDAAYPLARELPMDRTQATTIPLDEVPGCVRNIVFQQDEVSSDSRPSDRTHPDGMRDVIRNTQLPQPVQSLREGEAAPPGKEVIRIEIAGKSVLVVATPLSSVNGKPTYSVKFTDGSMVEMTRSHNATANGVVYRPIGPARRVHPALYQAVRGGAGDVDLEGVIKGLLQDHGLRRDELGHEQYESLRSTVQTRIDEIQTDMRAGDAFLDLSGAGDEDGQGLFLTLMFDGNLNATVAQLRDSIRGTTGDQRTGSSVALQPTSASVSTFGIGTASSTTTTRMSLQEAFTMVDGYLQNRNITRNSLSDAQYRVFVQQLRSTPTSTQAANLRLSLTQGNTVPDDAQVRRVFGRLRLEEALRQYEVQNCINQYQTHDAIFRNNYLITPGASNAQQPMHYPHFTVTGPGVPDNASNTYYRPRQDEDQHNCSVHSINAMFGCEVITDAEVLQYTIELMESDRGAPLQDSERRRVRLDIAQVGVEASMMFRILSEKKNLPVQLYQSAPFLGDDGNLHLDPLQLNFLDGFDRMALHTSPAGGLSHWVAFREDTLLDSRREHVSQTTITVSQFLQQQNALSFSAIILEPGARITAGGGNVTAGDSTSVLQSQTRAPVVTGESLILHLGTARAKPLRNLWTEISAANIGPGITEEWIKHIIGSGTPQTDPDLPGNLALFHEHYDLGNGAQRRVGLLAKYNNGIVVEANIDDNKRDIRKQMLDVPEQARSVGRQSSAVTNRVKKSLREYLYPTQKTSKAEIKALWTGTGGIFGDHETPLDFVLGVIDTGIRLVNTNLPDGLALYERPVVFLDGSVKNVRLLVTFDDQGVVTDANVDDENAVRRHEMTAKVSTTGAVVTSILKTRLRDYAGSKDKLDIKRLVKKLNDSKDFFGDTETFVKDIIDSGIRRNDLNLPENIRLFEKQYGKTKVELLAKYNRKKVEDVGLNNEKQRKRLNCLPPADIHPRWDQGNNPVFKIDDGDTSVLPLAINSPVVPTTTATSTWGTDTTATINPPIMGSGLVIPMSGEDDIDELDGNADWWSGNFSVVDAPLFDFEVDEQDGNEDGSEDLNQRTGEENA